ncbi:type II toxin-antitoxin system VapC family toxin [candidate division KSB1 bacterium]|nr:type II toxin-antitoxin system VapC family toxin [candidate division KSB1 bacterium]
MKYLLDTNICIKYLNGQSEAIKNNLELKKPSEITLCSIVKAELFYGAMKSSKPSYNLEKIRYFTDRFISLLFDDNAAQIYGNIKSYLEKKGLPIGPNDLLIASIAISQHIILVTNNIGEFSRLDELKIECWDKG